VAKLKIRDMHDFPSSPLNAVHLLAFGNLKVLKTLKILSNNNDKAPPQPVSAAWHMESTTVPVNEVIL
jgi:hypothetical protein